MKINKKQIITIVVVIGLIIATPFLISFVSALGKNVAYAVDPSKEKYLISGEYFLDYEASTNDYFEMSFRNIRVEDSEGNVNFPFLMKGSSAKDIEIVLQLKEGVSWVEVGSVSKAILDYDNPTDRFEFVAWLDNDVENHLRLVATYNYDAGFWSGKQLRTVYSDVFVVDFSDSVDNSGNTDEVEEVGDLIGVSWQEVTGDLNNQYFYISDMKFKDKGDTMSLEFMASPKNAGYYLVEAGLIGNDGSYLKIYSNHNVCDGSPYYSNYAGDWEARKSKTIKLEFDKPKNYNPRDYKLLFIITDGCWKDLGDNMKVYYSSKIDLMSGDAERMI